MTRGSSFVRSVRSVCLPACLAAVLLFGGCQAIFTYSPFSGLQQDPADMPPAQRLQYAKDALASGDTDTMKTAYDAIKDDPGADAQYTAAQLAIEISGVPTVLRDIATDTSQTNTKLTNINQYIVEHNLDPDFMVAAAGQLAAAAAAGVTLTDTDRAMGAIGLMLEGAHTSSGGTSWDIKDGNPQKTAALGFLQPAYDDVSPLSSGDPQRQFIVGLYDFINGLAP